MENYIGKAVHGYRNPDNSSEETVTRVIAIGNHCYDGTQHETAIKAATDRHPRPRWYVGYGADYVPASKADIANIIIIKPFKDWNGVLKTARVMPSVHETRFYVSKAFKPKLMKQRHPKRKPRTLRTKSHQERSIIQLRI